MPSPLSRLALCCTLSLALAPVSSLAQAAKSAAADKDMAAVEHYTLTMEKATQYGEVFNDLSAYVKAHPEVAKKLEGESDESLSIAEQRVASEPAVAAILTRHGFTAHEFVLFGFALFQAAFASETAKQNGIDPAKMAAQAHVNPANMTFVQQHKAEIESMMAKLKEASDKTGGNN